MSELTTLTITKPDDWHIHLRDGEALAQTVKDAAQTFARAIVMPNLVPPITTAEHAVAYAQRISSHVPSDYSFQPLMTVYLTDNTTPADMIEAKRAGVVACKLYPAGATTNSASGVTDIKNIYRVIEEMQRQGLLLLIHGEVTSAHIDIFDREKAFIDATLKTLTASFPELKIVFEHITTADAAQFVESSSDNIAATITAHHLLFNRNHLLVGGVKPHYYCLPVLKRNTHQAALIKAATSGNTRFFLGTDSAPHAQTAKEASCGCAGCYTAYTAIELYAQAFEGAQALDKLEAFASFNGADFYGLPRNKETITLQKAPWTVPESLPLTSTSRVIPLLAGETLNWKRIG